MKCLKCDKKAHCKQLCRYHYYRSGPDGSRRQHMPTRGMSDDERFDFYTEKSGKCLIWTGATSGNCKTHFHADGKNTSATRYSYKRANGEIPTNKMVSANCGTRYCVEPTHLTLIDRSNQGVRIAAKKSRTWHMGVEARFHFYTLKTESCWLWQGATYGAGRYGAFYNGQKTVGAHRYSYELHHGPLPEGLLVCHACDNPICVNPEHLFAGSTADNNKDRDLKGRSRYPRGEAHHHSRLSSKDIETIKMLAKKQSQASIARAYGVDQSHISRIVNNKCRANG